MRLRGDAAGPLRHERLEPGIGAEEIWRHVREMGFLSVRERMGGEQVRVWKGFVPQP
jgi:hypothetical protein